MGLFKAHLLCGKNCAKIVHFIEQKKIFCSFKTTDLYQFLPLCKQGFSIRKGAFTQWAVDADKCDLFSNRIEQCVLDTNAEKQLS